MERPLSQLENIRPSNMKQPSRLPALCGGGTMGRTLLETSQSDLNTRYGGHQLGVSLPNGSIKHKISGLPEPPTKRKTLIERAGEPLNTSKSHIPPPTKTTRPDTAPSASHNRALSGQNGIGAHRAGVPTAAIAGVQHPPSRQQAPRQIGLARPPSASEGRQASVESESDLGVSGKRKGTPTLNFLSNNFITIRKRQAPAPPQSDSSRFSSRTVSSRSQHSGSHTCTSSSPSEVGEPSEEIPLFGSISSRQTSTRASRRSVSSTTSTVERGIKPRETSLIAAFDNLSLSCEGEHKLRKTPASKSIPTPKRSPPLEQIREETSPSKIPKFSCTPTLRHAHSFQTISSSPSKRKVVADGQYTPATATRRTNKTEMPVFLTKEKLTSTAAWDTKGRLEDMEALYAQLRSQFASAADSKSTLEESLTLYKSRVQELSQANKELTSTNRNLSNDLERARNDLHTTTADLRQARRDNEHDVNEAERKHERMISDLCNKQEKETYQLERELEKITQQGINDIVEAKRNWEKQKIDALSDLTTQHWDEIEEMKTSHQDEVAKIQLELDAMRRLGESRATESAGEVQILRETMSALEQQLEATKTTLSTLRSQVAAAESKTVLLEQEKTALVSKAHFLEGNQEAQSLEFTSMSDQLQDAINGRNATMETLRKEEMLRRKLNATILELRGNIRVFVRLRPLLSGEEGPAKVEFPDLDSLDGNKEMTVYGSTTTSAMGKERREKHDYAFDRVFGPATANRNVFADCQDLIQSVVDGYNVSILSYGQTGSGKTYGMSGPDGIIPSAIGLLLSEMQRLKEKDWEYVVVANFVEVYNETLNDLLGDAKTWDEAEDLGASVRGKKKEKHEIHHDATTGKTSVSNLTAVTLWPPPDSDLATEDAASYTESAATDLLDTAAKNRRVAATKANERSSRSHSVFILTLKGHCSTTGESSEGILNLVDLAGSERLKQSGAEGNRMKETQAINKSLSALGDVIAALGAKKSDDSHVPYRNSKVHWQESRSSLLFGSKVHGTHIGAAKKR